MTASKEHATSRRAGVGHRVLVLVVVCPAATAAPLSAERRLRYRQLSSAGGLLWGCEATARTRNRHHRSSEIAGGCCARCCPKCQETRSRSRSRHMLDAQLHRLNSATGTRGLSTTAVAELACGAGGGPRCPSHEQCSHNKCCAQPAPSTLNQCNQYI